MCISDWPKTHPVEVLPRRQRATRLRERASFWGLTPKSNGDPVAPRTLPRGEDQLPKLDEGCTSLRSDAHHEYESHVQRRDL